MSQRTRTMSTDSDSGDLSPTSRERRFSLTGFLFGSPGFSGEVQRQGSITEQLEEREKKLLVNQKFDLKDFMYHQNRILSDEDGFRRKDYIKEK